MARHLGLLLSFSIAGCAMPGESASRYVLLDEGARRAGLAVRVGDHEPSASVRPRALVANDGATSILIEGAGEARAIDVDGSEIVVVRGALGAIERWTFGDARPDVLVARGTEDDARALAVALGADLAPGTAANTFELLGPEVWERAAALDGDPPGVIELMPSVEDDSRALAATSDDGALDAPPDEVTTVAAQRIGLALTALAAGDVAPAVAPAGTVALSVPGPGDPFRDAAPSSLRFQRAEPGRYAMLMRDSHTGGCSRTWTQSSSVIAVSLELAPGGRATACRARTSRTTMTSMEIRATPEGEGLFRSPGSLRTERAKNGYRGTWTRLGDAIDLVLQRDDRVCEPLRESSFAPPQTWRLRCAAVRTGDATLALPGAGLACAVAAQPWEDNYGFTVRSLDNATALWMLFGPGRGWQIVSNGGRWGGDVTEVTRATRSIDARRSIDLDSLWPAL